MTLSSSTDRVASVSQTPGAEGDSTTPERPDALAALFTQLSGGETPNFLQMIAALSDISILVTPDGACPDCRIPA